MAPSKEQDARLAELILYISGRSETDPRFGAIKLNKILFFADAIAFGTTGEAITGQEYQRLKLGPAPRRLVPVRDALRSSEQLAIQQREHFGRIQDRTVALRPANLEGFSGQQVAIVDEVIQVLWDQNGTEASELTHRLMGWQLAKEGETIPLEAVFLSNRALSDTEIAHAVNLAQ